MMRSLLALILALLVPLSAWAQTAGGIRKSGAPVTGQIPFFANPNAITGDTKLTWDNTLKALALGTGTSVSIVSAALTANRTFTLPDADSNPIIPKNCNALVAGDVITSISAQGVIGCFTPAGGGAGTFTALTSGTNVQAAMLVGPGASLNYSGGGTINARTVAGQLVGAYWTKAVDPTTADNTAAGYATGDQWVNTTISPNRVFYKTMEAAGVATWIRADTSGVNNYWTKTVSPTTAENTAAGYLTGDQWVDTTANPDTIWFKTAEAAGSATWVRVDNAGITGTGDALVADPLSQFAATTSLQLKGVLSDETGSGLSVFATSPTLTTPVLGVATATSINGLTLTTSTGTLTIPNGVVLTGPGTTSTLVAKFGTPTALNCAVWVDTEFIGHSGAPCPTPSSTDTLTNKTLNAESTGNVVTIPYYWDLDLVGVSGGVAAHVWNDDPLGTSCTATAVVGTNRAMGVCTFPDSDGIFGRQITRYLPTGWTGSMDAEIWWKTTGTGNARFSFQTICYASDEADDAAFNTASLVTAAAGTSARPNKQTITGITTTGCAAGELMRIHFSRNRTEGSDTLDAALDVEKVIFIMRVAH